MINGLYTAASGLIAQTFQQDVIANNLANVNTTGYKKDRALYLEFPKIFMNRINDGREFVPGAGVVSNMEPIGAMGTGVQLRVDGIQPELTEQGSYVQTDNDLNLAIKGNAMFVIMTPNGIRYTRDGNFTVSTDEKLITQNGDIVMGESGEIIVDGNKVHVDESGRVLVDNQETDTLRLANFTQTDPLRKEGNNLFYLLDGGALPENGDEDVRVLQGYLEGSNVNVVREMVDMITAYRAYEASQKSIQAQDQTLGRAVNDVGNITI